MRKLLLLAALMGLGVAGTLSFAVGPMTAYKPRFVVTVTQDGVPVPNAYCEAKINGLTVTSGYTDNTGQCVLPVPAGTYDVSATLNQNTQTQYGLQPNGVVTPIIFDFD